MDDFDNPYIYSKDSRDETIGGISMKLDFMSRDITTPFGASLQYFDESIYGSA
jgi:hypothetical protein